MRVLILIDSGKSRHDLEMWHGLIEEFERRSDCEVVDGEDVPTGRPGTIEMVLDQHPNTNVVVLISTAHKVGAAHDLPAAEARKVMDRNVFASLNVLKSLRDDQLFVLVLPRPFLEPGQEELAWYMSYGAAGEMENSIPNFIVLSDWDDSQLVEPSDWAEKIDHMWRVF